MSPTYRIAEAATAVQFDAAQIISEIGTNEGALDAYRRAHDL